MNIAFASSDGQSVTCHFGKAGLFMIYEKLSARCIREFFPLEQYSENDPAHAFQEERFNLVYNGLKDCNVLYVNKIGDKPKQELLRRGIEVIETQKEITALLNQKTE